MTHDTSLPDVVVAVDIGGTALKGSLVSETGETVAISTRETPAAEILDAVLLLINELMDAATAGNRRVIAAAVVTPGMAVAWRDAPRVVLSSLGSD